MEPAVKGCMPNYRRYCVKGGTYFFTVVTYRRQPIFNDASSISLLRQSFKVTKQRKPYTVLTLVVLPDHLHTIWKMPEDEHDFPSRWRTIKASFSIEYHKQHAETRDQPLWQRGYWEHLVRDENDLYHHLDYIHYNPVKHGYVNAPREWKNSSFQRYITEGLYEKTWGENGVNREITEMDIE